MPQRQLSTSDWALVVRTICDVQHLLTVANGGTLVERGTSLLDADDTTSMRLDTSAENQALEAALKLLGFNHATDPLPPQVRDQVAALLHLPRG